MGQTCTDCTKSTTKYSFQYFFASGRENVWHMATVFIRESGSLLYPCKYDLYPNVGVSNAKITLEIKCNHFLSLI